MPPNDLDLEAGVPNGARSLKHQEAGLSAPDNISRGAPSSVLSIQPDGENSSREPELKDVWNKWRGKPQKKGPYAQPPAKGERHELEVFQNLVGIHFLRPGGGLLYPEHQGSKPASPMHDIFMPSKAAAMRWRNRGLYDRTLSQDIKMRVLYGMSNYIISFLYLLQILIAAALTGLSAYQQASSVALTTLGAINTVLAGILAWLNGQGMPVRFRRARDQYREVVRAIEDTERTFAEIDYVDWAPGTRPNPYAERDRLEQMYDEARQDQERNYPDIQEGPDKNQMQNEAKGLRENISEEKTKKEAFAKTLEQTKNDHKSQLKKLAQEFGEKLKEAVKEQEERIRTEVEYKHLQKQAAEQARNCTCGKHKGAPVPLGGEDAPSGPQPVPREAPQENPPAPTSPPRSRARSPVRSPPPAAAARSPPATTANEPPARSPERPRSPVIAPTPAPAPIRSPSPPRPRSSSPPPPARSPSSSPSRSSSSSRPSEDGPTGPAGDRPRKRGPSGLFTNVF